MKLGGYMKKEVAIRKSKSIKSKSSVSQKDVFQKALKAGSSMQKKKLTIAASSKKNILKFISENLAS